LVTLLVLALGLTGYAAFNEHHQAEKLRADVQTMEAAVTDAATQAKEWKKRYELVASAGQEVLKDLDYWRCQDFRDRNATAEQRAGLTELSLAYEDAFIAECDRLQSSDLEKP
jgi:hypothetical protein